MKINNKYYPNIKLKVIIPILTLVLSLITGCTPSEPPVDQNSLKLTLIDVSVTEAYLNIKTGQVRSNEDIILLRDGKEVLSFKNTQKDTIVTDTALTENTTYKYTVIGRLNGKESGRSEEVTAVTLMPTSHDYVWRSFTFGDNSYSSYNGLTDIAIINENDIWVVGEIYLNDSLGNVDSFPYGAAHWNGIKWDIFKVPSRSYPTVPPWPTDVAAITLIDDTLYASNAGNLMRYENNKWNEIAMFIQDEKFNGRIRRIWGKDKSNIYCVGLHGSIYHVKGNTWNKVPNLPDATVMSICGIAAAYDGNQYELFCPVYDWDVTYKSKLLKITPGDKISEIAWNEDEVLSDVWTNKGFPIYAVGNRLFENSKNSWKEVPLKNVISLSFIRGCKLNDIAAAGVGSIVHYNGKDWKVYNAGDCVFFSVDIKDNIIAAVGYIGGKAVVVIGKR